ncbi:hypothetical protein E4H12_03035 [Candidatus Thorarchaeota archaeon]|nr:MAG: hypothetical protein E4H12_03035 [Candidatus Thorarchaeota archaeon]
MSKAEKCTWLGLDDNGKDRCRLRGQKLSGAEVSAKCKKLDLATICADAYSSLSRGQEAIYKNSTDAFPWLIESATQFENLGEIDNAVMAYVKAIHFANKNDLAEKAYDFFRAARTAYEKGLESNDSSLKDPAIKDDLAKAGNSIIEKMRKISERTDMTDMQSELKAAVLGGVSLKKAETEKSREPRDLIFSHGRSLYEKKSEEYKDGAKSYIASGMIKNAVMLSCMGALADLMLGKPKDGMAYLAEVASSTNNSQIFHEHPCFEWTKLVFKALISRDENLMITVNKLFLEIPWSFKDDREFARRVMESIERRITA